MAKIEEQVEFLPASEPKKEKKNKRKRELAMQDDISNQINQIQDFIDSNKKKKKKFTIKLSEDMPSEKPKKAKKSKSNDDAEEIPGLNKGKGPKMIVAQDNSTKTSDEQKSKKLTKKEKKLLRENKNTDHETKGQLEALSYLKLWKCARNSWKFNSNRQSWLVKHALYDKRIKDSDFDVLLEYFKGMKGNIREVAKTNAKKMLEESLLEMANESTDNANKTVVDPGRKRAKQILEIFSNDI